MKHLTEPRRTKILEELVNTGLPNIAKKYHAKTFDVSRTYLDAYIKTLTQYTLNVSEATAHSVCYHAFDLTQRYYQMKYNREH